MLVFAMILTVHIMEIAYRVLLVTTVVDILFVLWLGELLSRACDFLRCIRLRITDSDYVVLVANE